ncbi:carboxyl transferase domain-containing protein [Streptomyces qinglanensis]|uniref:Acetyl-coenzyme A carboxylase carboxyl transferase subunits beta/alpha n=1 Tax=Streptomyces qinglanensis TaxID=943816 RepID=A0A1H9N4P0_9ACTN|nr:carboxyl transferase domain-containing protein [Streptomyces qinglanensis]SER30383.1 acetyl-CoA carboxylase carboxyl transferase subunit beta [Streptomyces qinglanensis]
MSPTGPRTSARTLLARLATGFRECHPGGAGPGPSPADGPLGWPGYDAMRARAHERTGEHESVVCGTGRIGGSDAVLLCFEFGYLGGSLGERTGDRIEAAHTRARELRLPLVTLVATGGSRMQEGMRALVQLQRVARQSALTRAAGLPQLAVVRDPTTGGGWATLAAGADVVLALPGAQAAFAGSRVRPGGAEPAAYTAEAQHAAGHLDRIVPEAELPEALARWLTLLTPASGGRERPEPVPVPGALPGPSGGRLPAGGAEAVARARAADRPRAAAYLDACLTGREEISGDRCGGTDPGVRCGFGRHAGRTVAYAAQCGTPTRPAGYRTAARLIRLADRLRLPVLTLIDTPGAANGPEDERAGAGPAIAEVFSAVAEATVPLTSLLIGEGGSGGALVLAAPGSLWATPDSYFSVIAPESAAAILKRGPDQVQRTAEELRLRPQDAVELGVVRGVVGPAPGAAAERGDPRGAGGGIGGDRGAGE